MVRQGYLRNKVDMDDRAVDHTSPSVRAAAAVAAGHAKMPVARKAAYKQEDGQALQTMSRAQRIAKGQADFLKDAMHAKAMKDYEDAQVQAPLAKEMIKQGYLKPHNIIKQPVVHHVTSKPVARPSVRTVSKLAPKSAGSSPLQEAEAKKLLSIVNRGVYHEKSNAKAVEKTTMQMKQAKLLNLAMKAEKDEQTEDADNAKSMVRDIQAEQQSSTIAALASKHQSVKHDTLIENAIKEQNAEIAKGEATERVDYAALARTEQARKSVQQHRDKLFREAEKEISENRATSEAEHAQMKLVRKSGHATSTAQGKLSAVQDKLVEQAIRARDSAMNREMAAEEDHASRCFSNASSFTFPILLSFPCPFRMMTRLPIVHGAVFHPPRQLMAKQRA